jgi:small-conductance mechanosensitive channel
MSVLRRIANGLGWRRGMTRYANSEVRHLANRVDQLVDFVAQESQIYVDEKIQASGSGSAVSAEALEKRAFLSVAEAKAYTDGALEHFDRSVGAIGFATAELRDRVAQVENTAAEAGAPLGGIESRLASLKARLTADKAASPGQPQSLPTQPELIEQIERTLSDLNAQLANLERAINSDTGAIEVQRDPPALAAKSDAGGIGS